MVGAAAGGSTAFGGGSDCSRAGFGTVAGAGFGETISLAGSTTVGVGAGIGGFRAFVSGTGYAMVVVGTQKVPYCAVVPRYSRSVSPPASFDTGSQGLSGVMAMH
jgi:hypothetical protein